MVRLYGIDPGLRLIDRGGGSGRRSRLKHLTNNVIASVSFSISIRGRKRRRHGVIVP